MMDNSKGATEDRLLDAKPNVCFWPEEDVQNSLFPTSGMGFDKIKMAHEPSTSSITHYMNVNRVKDYD